MSEFFAAYSGMLWEGIKETLYMVSVSSFFAYLFGLPIGIALIVTADKGIHPIKWLNSVLGWIVNIGRSIPFIILMVALFPFTRAVIGTTLGPTAAIVALVVSATPFVARMVESSLAEVDAGVIEASQAMGAGVFQIITKVLVREAVPSLIMGAAVSVITIMGYSAMAGAVGGGGLGDIAIRYGYHRYQYDVMLVTIVLIVILVQIIQSIGNILSKGVDKRIK
ncbi:MAG: methionine ABC transporter permease [Clostridia bacterium]